MELFDLANFFIAHFQSRNEDNDLTNTKLNKLIYFAYGFYLAMTEKKLFNDAILAWKYGPVIARVYFKYKDIDFSLLDKINVDLNIFDNEDMQSAAYYAVDEFGDYSASKLTEITHALDSPWFQVREGNTISDEKIEEYFKKKYLKEISEIEKNDPFYSKKNIKELNRRLENLENKDGVVTKTIEELRAME